MEINQTSMSQELFGDTGVSNGATFSECRKYRYALWRIWNDQMPLVMFIGLNPSTANETKADPTIRRVLDFSKRWGYGGVYMMNLFSLVSSKPEALLTCDDPVNGNDEWLMRIAPKCERIIFAWGAFKQATERSKRVIAMFPDAYVLKLTNQGLPWHPLMVRKDVIPFKFKQD